jgi:two-component system chemotaxis response regulator CheY
MQTGFEGLKVLVIEDEKEARTMMRDMLSTMGVTQIFEASDGKEGLQFLDMAFDLVDIVLCDWNMPNMTGVSLLKQFRSVDNQTPFLMITGRGDMNSVLEAKTAGVSGYILKPFSLNQLEAKLRIISYTSMDAG